MNADVISIYKNKIAEKNGGKEKRGRIDIEGVSIIFGSGAFFLSDARSSGNPSSGQYVCMAAISASGPAVAAAQTASRAACGGFQYTIPCASE